MSSINLKWYSVGVIQLGIANHPEGWDAKLEGLTPYIKERQPATDDKSLNAIPTCTRWLGFFYEACIKEINELTD